MFAAHSYDKRHRWALRPRTAECPRRPV